MADGNLRSKFTDLESEPMFAEPQRRPKPPPDKPPRAVDEKECPTCLQKVGVYVHATRQGKRLLAYRRHWRVTNSGAGFPCPNSDQQVD